MIRKILTWTIFALIFIFIGFVFWLFFVKEDTAQTNTQGFERPEDFFPVNIPGLDENGEINPDPSRTGFIGTNLIPRLRQLSQVPVAGSISFEKEGNSSRPIVSADGSESVQKNKFVVFRYIERSTGHLYEAREDSLTQTRLSNTTIPRVVDSFFSKDGTKVLLRILNEDQETVETLSAKIVQKATTSPSGGSLIADGFGLEGPYLTTNIIDAEISSKGLTYLVPKSTGGSSLVTAALDDLSKKLVFESPLTDWIISRLDTTNILMTTKADSRIAGFSYLVNTQNGTSKKILGDLPGLTTNMSLDEKWLIYSVSRNNEFGSFVQNMATGETKKLGVNTLPEKCVFSSKDTNIMFCAGPTEMPRTNLPESWYQGLTSLDDSLWKIDLSTQKYDQILGDREESEESFDMIKLEISPNDDFMLFVNKKDLTLWSLDISDIVR